MDAAVKIEQDFCSAELTIPLVGINQQSVNELIEFIADHWLHALDQPKRYLTKYPFDDINPDCPNIKPAPWSDPTGSDKKEQEQKLWEVWKNEK